MVNYLRNNREVFPEFLDRNEEKHFYKELEYWQIPMKNGKAPPKSDRGSSLDVSYKSRSKSPRRNNGKKSS